jgi:hypothetical protein
MNQSEIYLQAYALNRKRTIDLLEKCLREPDPTKVLAFRPGPGRAHIAWQLMHVGVTEELFATERLVPPKQPGFTDLLPRFRGGSTPDDDIPDPDLIRKVLDESRKHLIETYADLHDGRLEEIPAALAERKLTIRDVFHILGWHEAHHHGQAHITFNIYKASGR